MEKCPFNFQKAVWPIILHPGIIISIYIFAQFLKILKGLKGSFLMVKAAFMQNSAPIKSSKIVSNKPMYSMCSTKAAKAEGQISH